MSYSYLSLILGDLLSGDKKHRIHKTNIFIEWGRVVPGPRNVGGNSGAPLGFSRLFVLERLCFVSTSSGKYPRIKIRRENPNKNKPWFHLTKKWSYSEVKMLLNIEYFWTYFSKIKSIRKGCEIDIYPLFGKWFCSKQFQFKAGGPSSQWGPWPLWPIHPHWVCYNCCRVDTAIFLQRWCMMAFKIGS